MIMKEEDLDIKDKNRTYYYNIHGKMIPDYESMMAYIFTGLGASIASWITWGLMLLLK